MPPNDPVKEDSPYPVPLWKPLTHSRPLPQRRIHWSDTRVTWVPPPSETESSTGLYSMYNASEGLWVACDQSQIDSNDSSTTHAAQLKSFHERWPPNRTSERGCVCLTVRCGLPPDLRKLDENEYKARFREDIDGMQKEFLQIVQDKGLSGGEKNMNLVTPEMIDELAVKYGVLGGKWMIYTKPYGVEELWKKIVQLVAVERGYGKANVSTRKILEFPSSSVSSTPTAPVKEQAGIKWEGGTPDPEHGHVISVYVDDYTNRKEVDELREALKLHAGVTWGIKFKPDAYKWLGIYRGNKFGLRASRYSDFDGDTSGEKAQKGLN